MSTELRDQVIAAMEEVAEDKNPASETEEVVEETIDEPENKEDSRESQVADEPTTVEEEEVDAPANWSQEDKEVLKNLDNEGRKLLIRRHNATEAAFTRKFQALAEDKKTAEKFRQAIGGNENYLEQIGVDPVHAVSYLINVEKVLRTGTAQEKAQILKDLNKQYVLPNDPYSEQPTIDPQLAALHEKLSEHDRFMLELRQERERKAQEEVQKQDYEIQQNILDFSTAKDAKGQLKYPHFEKVRKQMGDYFTSGLLGDVKSAKEFHEKAEQAYKSAVLLNEDLRDDYVSRYYTPQKREEDTRQKTMASKKAGFNVKSGSSADIVDNVKAANLREELVRNLAASQRI